jgi:hypothetical protein
MLSTTLLASLHPSFLSFDPLSNIARQKDLVCTWKHSPCPDLRAAVIDLLIGFLSSPIEYLPRTHASSSARGLDI